MTKKLSIHTNAARIAPDAPYVFVRLAVSELCPHGTGEWNHIAEVEETLYAYHLKLNGDAGAGTQSAIYGMEMFCERNNVQYPEREIENALGKLRAMVAEDAEMARKRSAPV